MTHVYQYGPRQEVTETFKALYGLSHSTRQRIAVCERAFKGTAVQCQRWILIKRDDSTIVIGPKLPELGSQWKEVASW